MPTINTAVSNSTNSENQGVVMGMLGSFSSTGRALGPAVGGFVYAINMLLPYIGSAVIALLSAIVLHLHVKKEKKHRKIETQTLFN
jgi:MFS transporter, DHA1 family, multidrug resistance protein